MLDSIGEVKAFQILSGAGASTPESITVSRAASSKVTRERNTGNGSP